MNAVFDLDADLAPGTSAAGLELGSSLYEILKKIGTVTWHDSKSTTYELLENNAGWLGIREELRFKDHGDFVSYLFFKNRLLMLAFINGKSLYNINVGKGYSGNFQGIRPGSDLQSINPPLSVEFNEFDDDFLILNGETIIEGISLLTDHRASLEHAPQQKIEYISIHNWSIRDEHIHI
ncbi:hypothetical protein ACKUFS_21430 [Pseudomonas cannabina]|uniref:Uncharacterized protein n=3 Tax=Pseudomonas syringae group TaxID=136849 RepID=A0A8T8C897_PSEYM|nr:MULTISPECIES: hypothetical protein [Pseudomonas syringae group]MBM0142361.1 hypothetical protein [Pseudomonas cannabina pv. alisalensis]QHE99835.1 hypothetical protein PMA4326_026620 [Pseudomonas syringae pv. maculicola str. ES4326]QQN21907.1 hypothetical protein JGS08_25735 [Pseudomonas cannabina pv. alisalensis]RMN90519.1 hypothetical protein ALQ51_02473 [Pseudomonas cannabina]UBY95543.1 hypothetical protein LCG56_16030 [Pseudomonas cannabina pv. alisalensis]